MLDEKYFLHWLYGATFYHGTTRYGQFPGYHVFATRYCEDDDLQELLNDLEGADDVALEAGRELTRLEQKNDIWMAYHDNPGIAMTELTQILRNYYFNVLNKEYKK